MISFSDDQSNHKQKKNGQNTVNRKGVPKDIVIPALEMQSHDIKKNESIEPLNDDIEMNSENNRKLKLETQSQVSKRKKSKK